MRPIACSGKKDWGNPNVDQTQFTTGKKQVQSHISYNQKYI